MKILVVSNTLPPESTATANLIDKLIPELERDGCQVDGLTLKNNFRDSEQIRYKKMTVYKAGCFNNCLNAKGLILRKLQGFYRRILQYMPSQWKEGSYNECHAKAIAKGMKKFKLRDYDAVVCVCAYYGAVEGVLRYKHKEKTNSKIVLYQVDPLTDNEVYPKKKYTARKEYEKRLYETCDCVFTTPIIYSSCEKNGFLTKNAFPVEFPLICSPKSIINEKISPRDEGEIRCVFSGFLYPTIRDARYTLNLFSKFKDERIKLYILGNGQETLLEEYERGPLNGRLVRLGRVPTEVSLAFMNDADVLVNIGNSVMNQVPSKIFDYISQGKTILNVCKSDNCPTLGYMNEYPLAINVMENVQLTDADAYRIEGEILDNYKKQIPFSKIKDIYYSSTPEYVAKQMLDAFTTKEK